MPAILRTITAALLVAALALMVSSFAPIALSDFARLTIRLAGFASLALGYVAFEARAFVATR